MHIPLLCTEYISYTTELVQTFKYNHVLLYKITDPTSEIPFQGSVKAHQKVAPLKRHRSTPLDPSAASESIAVHRDTEHS